MVADDPRLPDTWDQEKNIRWKTPIPGRGWGSPIVWGDRVFISAVHSDEEYDMPKGGLVPGPRAGRSTRHGPPLDGVLPGFQNRRRAMEARGPLGKPTVPRHPKNTYAAETPTTDGKRLYVLFGDLGLYCYDLDGKQLWTHEIEPKKTYFGYGAAASPIVVEGTRSCIVYDNIEDSYIAALDSETGKLALENVAR